MITHNYNSDITRVQSGIIVHGCNAQGVMGSGVAKQLRATYPEIFTHYAQHVETKRLLNLPALGTIAYSHVTDDLIIANCITQEYYGRDGRQYVSYEALETIFHCLSIFKTRPIHIPYLIGAGLGGGDEKTILEIINKTLYNNNIHFHYWK